MAITGIFGSILLNSLGMAQYVAGTVFFDTASNYNLSVVPLFVLMGEVGSGSRMSAKLFRAARVMFSGVKGGLAVASLGILIPPSIILVIYASIAEQAVARLFAAALFPGILLMLMLIFIAVALTVARRDGSTPHEASAPFMKRLLGLLHAWQFALLFAMTIGGIYAGVFSPNEAARMCASGL